MKLTTGVTLINILCVPFCKKVFWTAFLKLRFGFVIFRRKNIGEKVALKMLMKLTTNFYEGTYLTSKIKENVFEVFFLKLISKFNKLKNRSRVSNPKKCFNFASN